MHADENEFPGINVNGGYAQYLRIVAHSIIKLPAKARPSCHLTATPPMSPISTVAPRTFRTSTNVDIAAHKARLNRAELKVA
jgi:hypothetical protein